MSPSISQRRAFSLVEIVLAVGIIALALLAIFSMFGVALRSSSETMTRHEILAMSRSLTDFLKSTNAGFTNVFGWVKNPSTDPGIYAFVTTNGQLTNGLGNNAAFQAAARAVDGRLFRIVLSVSPNIPMPDASGNMVAKPTAATLPATAALFTNQAALPLQARVLVVPIPGAPTNSAEIVMTYDTAITR